MKAVNIAAIFSRYTETSAQDNEENVKRINLVFDRLGSHIRFWKIFI